MMVLKEQFENKYFMLATLLRIGGKDNQIRDFDEIQYNLTYLFNLEPQILAKPLFDEEERNNSK